MARAARGAVPDAPYKDKGWITLAQKQMLHMLLKMVLIKLSITAEQQEKRNNLATYFDSITLS